MSFSFYKLLTPLDSVIKYDRLSSLLLTPRQSMVCESANLQTEQDCDFNLDATFDNNGSVTNIKIISE